MISLPLKFNAEQARRLSGASSRQVRYWDQIGLVRPSVQSTNGRAGVARLYDRDDVLRLRAVVHVLQLGESLQAIGTHGGFDGCKVARPHRVCPGKMLLDAYEASGRTETWRRESLKSLYGQEPDPYLLTAAERDRYLSGHWVAGRSA